jgi:hypothetical protein
MTPPQDESVRHPGRHPCSLPSSVNLCVLCVLCGRSRLVLAWPQRTRPYVRTLPDSPPSLGMLKQGFQPHARQAAVWAANPHGKRTQSVLAVGREGQKCGKIDRWSGSGATGATAPRARHRRDRSSRFDCALPATIPAPRRSPTVHTPHRPRLPAVPPPPPRVTRSPCVVRGVGLCDALVTQCARSQ